MTQRKLSLSNLKSANLKLACKQMQFRNHRLRDSLSVSLRSDCLSHTLEKHADSNTTDSNTIFLTAPIIHFRSCFTN